MGMHSKECELTYKRDTYISMFIHLFTIAKIWKQLRCPEIED
jgi:hypothetical protein